MSIIIGWDRIISKAGGKRSGDNSFEDCRDYSRYGSFLGKFFRVGI